MDKRKLQVYNFDLLANIGEEMYLMVGSVTYLRNS